MSKWFGEETFKLGFGLMRLPKLEDGKTIDIEQTKEMANMFIAAGGTYFDTAYVYDDGRSEAAFKEAVADRYPRESYTIATKLNAWLQCHDEESAKQQFYTSLERTGAGYIDYYLLHAIQRNNLHFYDDYHIWDFVREQKEKGLIKYWGFSFHADPELLDELLSKYPDVDFIQLQINYADMENESVQARKNWEVAKKHGKSITVMEPVKGGALADPVPQVKALFDAAAPNLSYASWAIRYVASLDNIITVLSGMSNIAQMENNLSYMKNFKPLNEAEQEVIRQVVNTMDEIESIKCTACRYCVEGCPMSIPIPDIFAARNLQRIYNQIEGAKHRYNMATKDKGKAHDCVQCGQCEGACPQHLPIITLLQECVANLE